MNLLKLLYKNSPILLFVNLFSIKVIYLLLKAYDILDVSLIYNSLNYLFFSSVIIMTLKNVSLKEYLLVNKKFILALFAILVITTQTVSYYLSSGAYSDQIVSVMISCYVYFLLGLNLEPSDERNECLILTFIFFVILTSLFFFDFQKFRLDYEGIVMREMWGNYLLISDLFALSSIIIISGSFLKLKWKFLFSILAFFVLIFYYSRATIFSFVVSVTLFYIIFYRKMIGAKYIFGGIFFFVLLFVSLSQVFPNSKMFSLTKALKGNSMSERSIMLEEGISDIRNNIIWGKTGGQVKSKFSKYGAYIHNILSYWRQYGLLVFVSISILFLTTIFSGIKESNPQIVTLGIFLMIQYIFFRSFNFPFLWLYLGMGVKSSRLNSKY